jgi:hypothetical protein
MSPLQLGFKTVRESFHLTRLLNNLAFVIRLRQREKEWDSSSSKYWHTTAAVTIDNSLDFKLYLGAINKPQLVK